MQSVDVGFEIARAEGMNGVPYAVRVMNWNLQKLQDAWKEWSKYRILSDDIPRNFEGFVVFATLNSSLWFEVVDEVTDKQVGLMYLNQLTSSLTENRFVSANFHGVVWDKKASERTPVARAFIAQAFQLLRLHRMQTEIPLHFGGVIRAAKKIGFVPEGTLRSARPYNGEWYSVAVLGLLEDEVSQWAEHSHHRLTSPTEPLRRISLAP